MVQFADAAPETVELGRLPEFGDERYNPGNTRHITRFRVRTPAARLKDRITLVDMPGLDTGSASGAAWLAGFVPRCDLGIVLVDATDLLTPAETAID
ncbi:MAG: GTPase domain-containing protein [Comamonadaceae bacterium]|nr:GTPase domain-containing protein [Comamonadaceae bacterium]